MMWMHQHDRVLRSPEGEGSGGSGAGVGQPAIGAPQGEPASQPQVQPAPGEYVPRSMFEEARGTRDAAKERARVAEAENVRLAAELEQFKRASAKPPETSQPQPAPDGAAEIRARLETIEQERRAERQAERQRMLSKQLAASVPDEKRHSLIPTIIRDLHPNGLPDGDLNAIATQLLTTIKGQHPSLFDLPPGSPRTAQQVGPTGQVNWAEVRSRDEIPPGVEIPTEVYARLRKQNQGDTGLILGSRAQRPSK